MDKNSDDSATKDDIIKKFEQLNEKGGLPDKLVKNCMNENPELKQFQDFTNQKLCSIF
jgi:hypothetical protein